MSKSGAAGGDSGAFCFAVRTVFVKNTVRAARLARVCDALLAAPMKEPHAIDVPSESERTQHPLAALVLRAHMR